MDEFWMVWHEGDRAPTQKHETPGGAVMEAERLCRKHGGRFYLLHAEEVATGPDPQPPVRWVRLNPITPF